MQEKKEQVKNRDIFPSLLSFVKSFEAYKDIVALQELSESDLVIFTKLYMRD